MKKTLISVLSCLCVAAQVDAAKYEGEYSPAFSPDGQYLAYHKNSDEMFWDVVIKNITTGEIEHVTQSKTMEVDPAWSPGGSKLVFAARVNGDWDIHLYSRKTKQITPLVNNPGKDNAPRWTADGKAIVFTSERSGTSQLHQLDLVSNKVTQLTDTGKHINHPSISADGRFVVFDQYYPNPDGKGGRSEIFKLELTTKTITKLYSNEASSHSGKLYGNDLFVTSNAKGNWDIVKVALKSGKEQPLANETVNEMKATVFPPKKLIAYSRFDKNGVSKVVVKSIQDF